MHTSLARGATGAALVAALAAAVLGLAAPPQTPSAAAAVSPGDTLYAEVNDLAQITLKDAPNGNAVTTLAPGTYTIVVNDTTAFHNFHLFGPGAVNQTTSVAGTGEVTWTVTFVAGTYTFQCDAHAPFSMRETLVVAEPKAHAVSVAKSGAGTGAVTSDPVGIDCGSTCSASFVEGTLVTLSAVADDGWTFLGWAGACTGAGPCTLTISEPKAVTAAFGTPEDPPPATYALTATKTGTGKGTISSDPAGIDCGTTCSAAYAEGTTVSLSALPRADARFAGWSGACTGTGSCFVAMTGARAVGASFAYVVPGAVVSIQATKVAGVRRIVATVRLNRAATVRVALLRAGRALASTSAALTGGRRIVKLVVPRRVAAGPATARVTIVDRLANRVVATRAVRVPA